MRLFPKPVIRGNQLGVGLLLVVASLAIRAPGGDSASLLTVAALVALVATAGRLRFPVGLAVVAGGMAWTLLRDGVPASLAVDPSLPSLGLPTMSEVLAAVPLLVIPQLPLTLGNAVVGTADLEADYMGRRAARVTPNRLLLTSGVANLAVGGLGGMPLCHGSSGVTAYYRLGGRGGGVNLVAGGLFLAAGLGLGKAAPALFGLVPVPVLAALLAYTGARHALLAGDQRGWALAVALAMGGVGALTKNLAYGMAVGVPAWALISGWSRLQAWRQRARPAPAPAPAPVPLLSPEPAA